MPFGLAGLDDPDLAVGSAVGTGPAGDGQRERLATGLGLGDQALGGELALGQGQGRNALEAAAGLAKVGHELADAGVVADLAAMSVQVVGAQELVADRAVAGRGNSDMKVLGVTVLTSMDAEDIKEMGFECSVEDLVVAASADAKKKLEARRMQDAGFLGNLLKSFSPPGAS